MDKSIVLMPKGIALLKAAEVGFISEPPTDDEMKRFNEFWEEMEGYVIPYSLELYAHDVAQKYRAETQKATAQNVEVKQVIEEINRRTRIPFHPDISTSKDDTLQEAQSSSDKRR